MKKFEEHNNFTFGSVYLFDKEKNLLNLYLCNVEAESGQVIQSFKAGEGVIGRTAQEKKVVFIKDTSLEENYIDDREEYPEKSLLCVPMTDGDELFGVMNYSGRVNDVVFEDSDIEYCETIARLSVSRIKGLQMIALIEEQNRTLEIKVQERTASLRAKTNDINAMLQNMKQGIFTITEDYNIHHEYSAQLETILGTKDIANRPVKETIFNQTDIGVDQLDQMMTAMSFSFGEDEINWFANNHVFPTELKYFSSNEDAKIIELDWNPIFDDDIVVKIIVTVRDVTKLKELEQESEAQKRELSIIGEILNISQGRFHDFLDASKNFLKKNELIIKAASDKDQNDIKNDVDELFRNMHTIKGNARAFGLSGLTNVVHTAEQFYDDIRKGQQDWQPHLLQKDVGAIRATLKTYEDIFSEKLSSRSERDSGAKIANDDKELIFTSMIELSNHASELDKRLLEKVIRIVDNVNFLAVEDCLEHITSSLSDVASQLGKDTPQIVIKNPRVRIPKTLSVEFESILTHLLRNSIDHGLELPEQREKAGKNRGGRINLEVKETQDSLFLTVYDDGRGLDLEKVKALAAKNGYCSMEDPLTDDQIAEMIFKSGLSTSDSVSDISGRGVGMDAVRAFLAEVDGRICVEWRSKERNKDGCRAFQFSIHIQYHADSQAA